MLQRAVLLLALLGLIALPACSGDDEERLTIYSGRQENLVGPLLEQFAEETGIKIDVRYADSADLALLVEEEGDRTPADVFLSQSPGAIGFLANQGRLQELPSETLGLVEDRFRDADGLWVGLTGRVRVLVYNAEEVDEADLPDSVFDLTDPEYEGQVAVAPSNGSFQDFITGMRAVEGDDAALEWLQGMAENDSPVYANNIAIVQAVGRGEVPMGLANHYYNFQLKAEDPNLPTENHIFPNADIGALLLETGVGMLDSTDQPEEAQRFIEFLLGEQAQRYFSEETFEYPLAGGVEPEDELPPLADIATAEVPLSELEGGLSRTRELISESGLDAG